MLPPSLTLFAARVLSKTPHACFEAVPNAPGATAACQAEGSCGLPLGMPEPGRTLATDRATGRIEIGHGRTSADANRVHSVVVDCSKRPLRVELPRSRSGREGPLSLRVFGCLPSAGARGCTEAGVRKASREETAGRG